MLKRTSLDLRLNQADMHSKRRSMERTLLRNPRILWVVNYSGTGERERSPGRHLRGLELICSRSAACVLFKRTQKSPPSFRLDPLPTHSLPLSSTALTSPPTLKLASLVHSPYHRKSFPRSDPGCTRAARSEKL